MDDPFAGPDHSGRTFIRPAPGGFGAGSGGPTGGRPEAADDRSGAAGEHALQDHGLSPLLAAANRLLMLVPALRQTRSADPALLRSSLGQGVREFVTAATSAGIAPERINAARYILCTTLDEAATDTPWGGSGVWGRHSLLTEFHNEASGGEKVFQLMARLAAKPTENRDLLELIYVVIALGFEGRYRIIEGGRHQLEAVRARLAQLLAQARGAYPPALSGQWQTQAVAPERVSSWIALTLAALLTVLLASAAYAIYAYTLAGRSDPVYAAIQALRLSPPVATAAQPAPRPRLAQLLEPDIRTETIAVRDEVDRSVVTLRGDGLFAPATATLEPQQEELMRRIAQALAQIGGQVLVTGYTDTVPIRTLRFPSNWHLSEARARTVAQLLVQAGVPAERVRSEGRADGDPVASNETADGRRLNRRVEITLLARAEGFGRTGQAASQAGR